MIPPAIVRQVAENLAKYEVKMASLAVNITDPEELFNPNAVKVLTDHAGYVLYFSRAPIPWHRDQFASLPKKKHKRTIGLVRSLFTSYRYLCLSCRFY